MTARHWTSRHRDDLLTRVTVLTAGTAVLGAVGATGLAVGLAATAHPKASVEAAADPTPTDAAPATTDTAAPTPTLSPTAATAATVKARATSRAKATTRTVVTTTPVATKKAYTPPPAPPQPKPKPKPTAASGGS